MFLERLIIDNVAFVYKNFVITQKMSYEQWGQNVEFQVSNLSGEITGGKNDKKLCSKCLFLENGRWD